MSEDTLFQAAEISLLLDALRFAAEKHRYQRRKDSKASAYINHPIQAAEILWRIGEVREMSTIIAALLHDTIEDTAATAEEIEQLFGKTVAAIVAEVTDDKQLPKAERKNLQILHAPHLSLAAKQLKLADKIANIYDLIHFPPQDWSVQRKQEYLAWTESVVNQLRGCNPKMEVYYDKTLCLAKNTVLSSF